MRHARWRAVSIGVMATALMLGVTSCAPVPEPAVRFSAPGWLGGLADAHNSSRSEASGRTELSLSWSRPLGGTIFTRASIAPTGQIDITLTPGESAAGCVLGAFTLATGRKRTCIPIGPAGAGSSPIQDTVANVYFGEDGAVESRNEFGQQRWFTPVYGTPRTPQLTPDGNLLVVTHFGQVSVIDPQNGTFVAPLYDLIPPPSATSAPPTPLRPPAEGLAACIEGGPQCPVPAAPAVDPSSSTFYVVLWRAGAAGPQLVALQYGGKGAAISERWSSPQLPGSVTSSPVLSNDGKTVYVTALDGTIRAFDTAAGTQRWQYTPTAAGRGAGSVAVAADGTLVPAGGNGAPLVALRDAGDRAEVMWQRTDLAQFSPSALDSGTVGYTVVARGTTLDLLTYDTTSGRTLDQDPLPSAVGVSPGPSLGPNGEVLVPVSVGVLYAFR